ncbi:hypothetical protein RI367_007104 [Sorochytrium milnesiophthora]
MVLSEVSRALVPLGRLQLLTRLPATRQREITVYVKGTVFPHVSTVPVPVTTLLNGALMLLRATRVKPIGFVASLLVDTTLNASRLAYQYYTATQSADERSHHLANILANIRTEYDHVRVVCHSLGTRHLVSALAQLSADALPNTVHMCASAVTESFVEPYFHRLAKDRVYVYWTPKDTVLGVMFRAMSRGEAALGHVGVQGSYQAVESVDVSEHFGMPLRSVHSGYAAMFHRFAREYRGDVQRGLHVA